jgi:hypothetical protein
MTPVSPLLRRAILQKIQRVKMKWDSLTGKYKLSMRHCHPRHAAGPRERTQDRFCCYASISRSIDHPAQTIIAPAGQPYCDHPHVRVPAPVL